jgi:putative flippase GtrA
MTNTHTLRGQATRFAVVGLSGAVVNLGLLSLLYGALRVPLFVGIALASELAVLSNFLLNNRWTFGRHDASLARLARFNVSSIGGLAIATGTTAVLISSGLPYQVADLAGIANGAVCNFLASALWTWRI